MPEQPMVSTRASSMTPFLMFRDSLQVPCWTVDQTAPVIKSITINPNPVDCGKTYIISVEVTD